MFKKKQKKNERLGREYAQSVRMDTETDTLPYKQSKTRAELAERFQSHSQSIGSTKMKLKCKQLEKLFISVKAILEQQLDHLLIGEPIWQTYETMIQSQLFKTKAKSKDQITDDLDKLIQALQLFYSKLHNNEKAKDIIFIKDQSQLLLFFKHLFGKPYTICNLPNFRKVLNTIWQHQIFDSFDPKKMVDHFRQWACGIEYPLNPAAIPIHRLVFTNPSLIKKYALLLCNTVTYTHIDIADCIGLTPLLLAVHSNRTDAYEQILKSGASLFKCPLTLIKNRRSVSISKKGTKETIEIIQPLTQRRQFNAFQILLAYKQYQQIVNILSLNEVYKLKKLKKSNIQVNCKLSQIPDCCLQIHWKTFKGFLSFKQLPKDVITVYKKGGSLRIDYHLDDIIQPGTQQGHYSILIRAGTEEGPSKLQYYYIDHNKKKIYNLMKQIHSQKLKLRYQQITQMGSIEQQYITQMKSTSKTADNVQILQINAQFCYQNVSKAPIYEFKDIISYEKALFQSDIIDYSLLQQSQTWCTLNQNVGSLPKVKSKLVKSSSKFNIEWVNQKIKIKHIAYILSLLDKKSPLFLKLTSLFNVLLTEQCYSKYGSKLPMKMTFDIGSDFSLQIQLKNIAYMTLDDAVFGLQFRTKQMSYQQQNVGLESLQQTMIMSQNYSINMSRFLGKTQKLRQLEEQQANRKFEQLLSQQIAGNISDEEDSSMNEKKQKITNSERTLEYQQFQNK